MRYACLFFIDYPLLTSGSFKLIDDRQRVDDQRNAITLKKYYSMAAISMLVVKVDIRVLYVRVKNI